MNVQRDTLLSKPIPGDADLISLFLKIRVRELDMEGLCIGNELYGAVFGSIRLMNRRNDGECLLLGLAAKIPAAEVVAHMGTSRNHLKEIVPILPNYRRKKDDLTGMLEWLQF